MDASGVSSTARLGLAAAATALLAVPGCGSSDAGAESDTAATASTTVAKVRTGPPLRVVSSDFGRVVADAKGEALYLFTADGSGQSQCYGDCARAWPPYIVAKRKPAAGRGADAALIGTVKRSDGRLQGTYAGKPLYYYVTDSPGNILCQDVEEFGGHWYVIKPSGKPVL